MNTKGSTSVPCGSHWNHATTQGGNAVTQLCLDGFWIFSPKDPLWFQVVLNGIDSELWVDSKHWTFEPAISVHSHTTSKERLMFQRKETFNKCMWKHRQEQGWYFHAKSELLRNLSYLFFISTWWPMSKLHREFSLGTLSFKRKNKMCRKFIKTSLC